MMLYAMSARGIDLIVRGKSFDRFGQISDRLKFFFARETRLGLLGDLIDLHRAISPCSNPPSLGHEFCAVRIPARASSARAKLG